MIPRYSKGDTMAKRKIEMGDITETIFISGLSNLSYDNAELLFGYLQNFCVDVKGRIRKSVGIVNSSSLEDDENMDFVPMVRYEIHCSPWNSHDDYVKIELPNPKTEPELYETVRNSFINEIETRLSVDVRTLK